ncbi:CRISPR-associated endoribonuclease Cas2 [Hyphomicrobiales bacterium]|nr:CRISPR-associated endoribonuclease Cas2 [Hyphomicrobiales bacterium]CAH1668405.1 CRISPR-associated endoribonuclease Cas2 [Hyphomicrobiales bacterium]
MAYFVVSYDLQDEKDYPELWEEMDRLKAVKCLLSMYLVELNSTAKDVREHLSSYIDQDDRLMVIEFSKKPSYQKALAGTNNWVNPRFN